MLIILIYCKLFLTSGGPGPRFKKFFSGPLLRVIFPLPPHILEKSWKGGPGMNPSIPHGDVDDLIYQEEWTVSNR